MRLAKIKWQELINDEKANNAEIKILKEKYKK